MTLGTDLKLGPEPAGLSTEIHNALDAFAPEHDLIVPPRHAPHAPLAGDIPFVFDWAPMPLAPVQQARGRSWLALIVLALLATAALGAYLYHQSRPLDLNIIAAWASRLAGPADTARSDTAPNNTVTPAPAAAPSEARPNDPTPTDPLPASNERAVSPNADRKANTAPPPSIATSVTRADSIQNVAGEWRLDTQIEAGDSSFQSLKLHYEMTLKQDGDRVAGVGTKVGENTQTPVTMTGTIAGDRLTLNFIEGDTQPETRSKFVLLVDEPGTLRGRFSSSAAPSSGHVEARRVSGAP